MFSTSNVSECRNVRELDNLPLVQMYITPPGPGYISMVWAYPDKAKEIQTDNILQCEVKWNGSCESRALKQEGAIFTCLTRNFLPKGVPDTLPTEFVAGLLHYENFEINFNFNCMESKQCQSSCDNFNDIISLTILGCSINLMNVGKIIKYLQPSMVSFSNVYLMPPINKAAELGFDSFENISELAIQFGFDLVKQMVIQ